MKTKHFRHRARFIITNDNLSPKINPNMRIGYVDLTISCELRNANEVQSLIDTLYSIKKGFELPDTYFEL